MQGEVLQEYGLEWDRVLLTTLGVANKRLYELRLQTAQVRGAGRGGDRVGASAKGGRAHSCILCVRLVGRLGEPQLCNYS